MPAYIRGVPGEAWVFFGSGDVCVYKTDQPVTRDGIAYRRIYLLPTDEVLGRYGFADNDLDFTIDSRGLLIREYPESYIIQLSDNPERPIYFIVCNLDGTLTPKLDMSVMREQMRAKDSMISMLMDENEKLREQLKEEISKVRELVGQ